MNGKAKNHTNSVLEYLRRYKNAEVHQSDIADATGLTVEQVQGAIWNLRAPHNGFSIDSPRKGWHIFRGGGATRGGSGRAPVPMKAKANVVAMLDDGRLLLTVEGALYVGTELVVE